MFSVRYRKEKPNKASVTRVSPFFSLKYNGRHPLPSAFTCLQSIIGRGGLSALSATARRNPPLIEGGTEGQNAKDLGETVLIENSWEPESFKVWAKNGISYSWWVSVNRPLYFSVPWKWRLTIYDENWKNKFSYYWEWLTRVFSVPGKSPAENKEVSAL